MHFTCVITKPKDATKSTLLSSPDTTTATDDIRDIRYPINRLVDHKKVGKKNHFLVQWCDSKGSRSWEPEDNVTQYAIDQYFIARHAKAKHSKKCRC